MVRLPNVSRMSFSVVDVQYGHGCHCVSLHVHRRCGRNVRLIYWELLFCCLNCKDEQHRYQACKRIPRRWAMIRCRNFTAVNNISSSSFFTGFVLKWLSLCLLTFRWVQQFPTRTSAIQKRAARGRRMNTLAR